MKSLISVVDILDRLTEQFVEAKLYNGIDEANLAAFEARWLPLLAEKLQRATPEELAQAQAQDARWNWREKKPLGGTP